MIPPSSPTSFSLALNYLESSILASCTNSKSPPHFSQRWGVALTTLVALFGGTSPCIKSSVLCRGSKSWSLVDAVTFFLLFCIFPNRYAICAVGSLLKYEHIQKGTQIINYEFINHHTSINFLKDSHSRNPLYPIRPLLPSSKIIVHAVCFYIWGNKYLKSFTVKIFRDRKILNPGFCICEGSAKWLGLGEHQDGSKRDCPPPPGPPRLVLKESREDLLPGHFTLWPTDSAAHRNPLGSFWCANQFGKHWLSTKVGSETCFPGRWANSKGLEISINVTARFLRGTTDCQGPSDSFVSGNESGIVQKWCILLQCLPTSSQTHQRGNVGMVTSWLPPRRQEKGGGVLVLTDSAVVPTRWCQSRRAGELKKLN